jgi:hypothetical protein
MGLRDFDPSRVGRSSTTLTGSPDTAEAGRRILYWAAAAHDPARWRRPKSYPHAVRLWARALVHPLNDKGDWRLLHQPIRWAVDFAGNAARRKQPLAEASNYVDAGQLADKFGFTKHRDFYRWLDEHQVEHFAAGRRHKVHAGEFLNAYYAEQRRKECDTESDSESLETIAVVAKASRPLNADPALSSQQREPLKENGKLSANEKARP